MDGRFILIIVHMWLILTTKTMTNTHTKAKQPLDRWHKHTARILALHYQLMLSFGVGGGGKIWVLSLLGVEMERDGGRQD